MTTPTLAPNPVRGVGRVRWMAIVAALFAIAFAVNAPAQAPAAPGGAAAPLSAEELDALVARIALYPDDLVAIILPAATNPLQLVQADRFLEKRKTDPKAPIDDKLDDAVKSLLNYPEVVKAMSGDLDWTVDLGEAVVADQGAVLEAIQTFRRKTQAVGNLKSDAKQVIVVEKEVIKIVPADPQVIYVPQYNPATVVVYGGYSTWGYYPSPYPVYYYPYPPGAALATGLIWGAAIGAAWHGGHYAAHYGAGGNNNININRNTTINTGNINTGNVNRGGGAAQGGGTQWKSNKQPGQVSSGMGRSPSAGAGVGYRPSAGSTSGAGSRPSAGPASSAGAGSRPSAGSASYQGAGRATQPSGGGSKDFSSGSGGGGGSAFGGSSSGRTASMDSSRGASSRSSMPSGGGARGGGGGGRGGRR